MRRYLALVREAFSLATMAPVSVAAHIAGSVVEVAVVAAALRAMLGLSYASSVTIAMIVSSPAATYVRVFGFPQNLIPEASLPPSALRRLETLVQLLVGAVLSPLYVLALTTAAAALGVAHWGALNPLYIVALSIPPMLNRGGVSSLLEYLRADAMKRLRMGYQMWGPPATAREIAGAFFEMPAVDSRGAPHRLHRAHPRLLLDERVEPLAPSPSRGPQPLRPVHRDREIHPRERLRAAGDAPRARGPFRVLAEHAHGASRVRVGRVWLRKRETGITLAAA
jgi:hypothetical protein